MWLTQEELQPDYDDDNNNKGHEAPFLYWFVGPYRPYAMNSVRPAVLLRPYFYTTLSDRLASRPFLTHVRFCVLCHCV